MRSFNTWNPCESFGRWRWTIYTIKCRLHPIILLVFFIFFFIFLLSLFDGLLLPITLTPVPRGRAGSICPSPYSQSPPPDIRRSRVREAPRLQAPTHVHPPKSKARDCAINGRQQGRGGGSVPSLGHPWPCARVDGIPPSHNAAQIPSDCAPLWGVFLE